MVSPEWLTAVLAKQPHIVRSQMGYDNNYADTHTILIKHAMIIIIMHNKKTSG